MQQLYQNSMIIAKHFDKSIIFVIFTANSQWLKIQNALKSNQTISNRFDIVVRVFNIKKKTLLQDLKNEFDRYCDVVWIIEYQKRDLFHLHVLLFLHRDDAFLNRWRVNELIRAKLSNIDMNLDESLRLIVERQFIHYFCESLYSNAFCMIDNSKETKRICSKSFLKSFQEKILMRQNDYSLYRRRANERIWIKRIADRDVQMNNSWIISYNSYLTRSTTHTLMLRCAFLWRLSSIFINIYTKTRIESRCNFKTKRTRLHDIWMIVISIHVKLHEIFSSFTIITRIRSLFVWSCIF